MTASYRNLTLLQILSTLADSSTKALAHHAVDITLLIIVSNANIIHILFRVRCQSMVDSR